MNKSVNSSSQSAQAASTDAGKDFFNLHLSGIGYLSRVRWVTPNGRGRKSEPFLCCAINAMHGPVDDPNYSYLDLRVSGEEAIAVIEQLQEAVEQDRKVFVSFKVGDIYAHSYERTVRDNGRNTGQKEPAALIKGRLLLINMAKVDDELVYQREDGDDQQSQPAQAGGEGGQDPADDDTGAHEPQPRAGQRGDRAERQPPRANVPVRDRSASRSYGGARH